MSIFFDLPESELNGFVPDKKPVSKPKRKEAQAMTCEQCGLDKSCLSPKMPVSGRGKLKILILAEAPGKEEDRQGIQLIGRSGQLLREVLSELGYDLDRDFWKTNALICRPPENRTPTGPEINACRKHLLATLEEKKPYGVIVLGAIAWESLMSARINGRVKGKEFTSWTGEKIPDQELGFWICPTFHPSFVLRSEKDASIRMMFKNHLKAAIEVIQGYPEKIDWESKIYITTDVVQANITLDRIIESGSMEWAFDYETTGKKPHRKGHEIVSVSFSNGKIAYAFPYFKDVLFQHRIRIILQSDFIGKIAHNARFEGEWTEVISGYPLKNLVWDTQIGQHCLANNKPTGLKWLTFVKYGILGYNDSVEKFIESCIEEDIYGDNAFNRIKEAPIEELLKYNAADSLFTYWHYEDQEKRLIGKQKQGFEFFMDGSGTFLKMHHTGINLDMEILRRQKEKASRKMQRIESNIQGMEEVKLWDSSDSFDFNSTKDLKHLLFDILKIKSVKQTDKGNQSVDEEALSKFHLPLTDEILKWRKWQKAKGTYLAQFEREQIEGKIYAQLNLTIPDTYRSSGDTPNLQNIYKREEEMKLFIRSFIRPSVGNRLIEYDYKMAEVCVSACYNKDPKLLKYVCDPDADMHRDVGCQLFLKTPETLNKKTERHLAKNKFVFAEFYGSFYGLIAPDIWEAIDNETRQHLFNKGIRTLANFTEHVEAIEDDFWNNRFPVYKEWKKRQWFQYQKRGYVDLLTGFRCYGPMDKKQVSNYPIQGSAFHLLLWYLNQVQKEIEKRKLNSRLIYEIHDAGIGDIDPAEESEIDRLVWDYGTQKIREHWDWICVPLRIEKERSEINGSWAEMSGCGVLGF